jgi:hypothetical protein
MMATAAITVLAILAALLILFSWWPPVADATRCRIKQVRFQLAHCREGNRNPNIDLDLDIGGWLADHPTIASAIV